ncbi:MAG: hypothetical protein AB9872_03420 [Solidesulfovibrio sp.]
MQHTEASAGLLQQTIIFAMNIQKIGLDRYYHPLLNRNIRHKNFECFYTAGDEGISGNVVDSLDEVVSYLKEFYEIDHISPIVIYIYHDLQMMNEAYKRELPNDQCCFVPIHGDISLITFSSKIGESSIKPVLAHEISHIIFSFLSGSQEVHNIQQTVPLWLDEGIALYIDNKYRLNIKEREERWANLLKQPSIDYFPRLSLLYTYFNRLDESIEFGPKGMMAYAYSYFCVLDLINAFGIATVVSFIKNIKNNKLDFDKQFEMYFGLSLDAFDNKTKMKISYSDKY